MLRLGNPSINDCYFLAFCCMATGAKHTERAPCLAAMINGRGRLIIHGIIRVDGPIFDTRAKYTNMSSYTNRKRGIAPERFGQQILDAIEHPETALLVGYDLPPFLAATGWDTLCPFSAVIDLKTQLALPSTTFSFPELVQALLTPPQLQALPVADWHLVHALQNIEQLYTRFVVSLSGRKLVRPRLEAWLRCHDPVYRTDSPEHPISSRTAVPDFILHCAYQYGRQLACTCVLNTSKTTKKDQLDEEFIQDRGQVATGL